MSKKTNLLINETSPYLLQHAYNPIKWRPWNEDSLTKAKKKNKLLLISIGYSACHWCHVMERESFEDPIVAEIMNENFICIKVDREERPDIDQIYMNAVQLLTGTGGWPLNCIALPDGRPLWGGTYFRKEDWKIQILQIAKIYKTDPEKAKDFASKVSNCIQQTETISNNPKEINFKWKDIDELMSSWKEDFDYTEGGSKGAPKFPMPNTYNFLLEYAHLSSNKEIEKYVNLTLEKIAYGGIYDQIGGGFCRYSTDNLWKVPHFEKMLYDNAQLVSLYSKAYAKYNNPLYKDIVSETLEFIKRELTSDQGVFYCALDADSENIEGKFYVWKKEKLKELLQTDFSIFKDYYSINNNGYWEDENYILLRKDSKEQIAKKYNLTKLELETKISKWKDILMDERKKRVRPSLDDKSLTSWNALMIKGFVDAYMVFKNKEYLNIAIKNADFILKNQANSKGQLFHSFKEGKSTINAYLEDYSLLISSLLRLYEATFDERWVLKSEKLTKYVIKHFYNNDNGMFYFTSDLDPELIARKMEINDNVIPSSNSVMAHVLFDLGKILDNNTYQRMSLRMLNNIKTKIISYPSGYANYASLILKQINPYYEIVLIGEEANSKKLEMSNVYHPNMIFIGSINKSNMSLLKDKWIEGSTMIYICKNKVCQLPIEETSEALKLIV